MIRRWILLLLTLSLLPASFTIAQESTRYNNPDIGIAFDMPSGWEIRTTKDTLAAGTSEALNRLDQGAAPGSLVIRVVTGTFATMKIPNAAALPAQLNKLVPAGVAAPAPVEATYGNIQGWEIEYTVAESSLSSKAAILPLASGRIALIRGFAETSAWNSGAAAQYEAIKNSVEFFLPTNLADPLANVPDDDGGVLWHYQAGQPEGNRQVVLGGLAFDPYALIYVAAGPRGILILEQPTGAFVNYIGPFNDDDNFVDLAIGIDAKIYLANATPGDNHQVVIANRAGGFERGFGHTGEAPGLFAPGMPRTIAVTRRYEIWTVSEGHAEAPFKRLYQFDRFGNLLKMMDIDKINPNLSNIKLDNNTATGGLFLIGETGGLNLLDTDGSPLATNLAMEIFSLTTPTDIAIAPGDNIIIGTDSQGFLEFAPSGVLLDRFGISIPADRPGIFQAGEVLRPAGLVTGIDGTHYFAETNPQTGISQVQAFRFVGDGALPLPDRPETGQNTGQEFSLNPADGGGTIQYGAVVQGSLNNQYPRHSWYFEGQAGDRVRITMRDISPDGTLDTFLKLFNPSDRFIAEHDDVGEAAPEGFKSTDSVLEFTLNTFGFHTIHATRFGGRGEYEMTLELIGG